MKILVFCPYYPPHIGGLETHADEFNKYLSRERADITVFTPELPKESPVNEIRYDGKVSIIRFPAFEIISNYPLPKFWSIKFWYLFSELFEKKFDIVISRTRFFSTSLLALIYSKIKSTRWIHIEHGSGFVLLSSKFKTVIAKLYDYTFGFLIFKSSNLNISISKAVQEFVYKFDGKNSPIIYRGLDIEEIDKINPDAEIKEKFKDKIIISFAGRLYKWKGVENSINAIKILPQETRDKVVFLIIGDGEDFSRLKEISKNESCIEMLSNLSREKVIGILKISDIYLHSAYMGGGLSTSLLEAMYCGCTIIATPNEGADEVIEDNKNGFLIDKSDPKIISEKIKEILNKNTEEQKKSAKELIAEKFRWEKSIETYLNNFEQFI
ncbi:MAG TPA: glycosyltransferase family 4 protein [Candidatus Moranbacteria bacterium]|nr:glycosyltransferase family 4 protein [Candidatus Moranbacteria bacterium]HRZ33329.1 glycosyltransferase family 4 protein [Candidatus Moranbacteria bacterium]